MGCLAAKHSDQLTEQQLGGKPPDKVFEDDEKGDDTNIQADDIFVSKTGNVEKKEVVDEVPPEEKPKAEEVLLNKSGNKVKKVKIEKNDFADDYLIELNECRMNPVEYANKVERLMKYIKENKEKGGGIFDVEGHPKIALNKGAMAFREFAIKLRTVKPLQPMELRNNLKVEISPDPKSWTDKDLISQSVHTRKSELKEKGLYTNFNFHFDIGSTNAEYSFILQLVDDTPFKGSRQKNLLNPDYKYIGISTLKVKNKNCAYFLFAN